MSVGDVGESPEAGPSRRRDFLIKMGAAAGAAAVGGSWYYRKVFESGLREAVFVARATSYVDSLVSTVLDGLRELGFSRATVRGKDVLLKPNMVEPHANSHHINTNPVIVRAAAEAFRRLDARRVMVGEGAGHVADALYVLSESGMGPALRDDQIPFVDLNQDSIREVQNAGVRTGLSKLTLPVSVLDADIVVSMPKMKTHHWVGVTLSMKNLFGVMPGIVYGWPKNALHQVGIPSSILDIYETVRPDVSIVDGVIGMEGDGPIMGEARPAGVMVIGRNGLAVDATCCRLMRVDPAKVGYLREAAGVLGPLRAGNIRQVGETLAGLETEFRLEEHIEAQRGLRLTSAATESTHLEEAWYCTAPCPPETGCGC